MSSPSRSGLVGLGTVLLGTAFGARVMAVDPLAYRLDFANRCGAEAVCNPDEESTVDAAKWWSESGADLAFDCTGVEGLALTALNSLRPGGIATCVGWGFEIFSAHGDGAVKVVVLTGLR